VQPRGRTIGCRTGVRWMITCKVEHRQVQAMGIRGGGPCIYQTRSQLSARYAVKGKAVLGIQGAVCGVGAGYEIRNDCLLTPGWLRMGIVVPGPQDAQTKTRKQQEMRAGGRVKVLGEK